MTTQPIQVQSLVKTFGDFAALDGIDLTVEEGSVHGFLGPNGAGKSTAIRVLLGLYRATAGQVRVLGRDPGAQPAAVARQVSYVPGDVALWPNLTGQQVLDALAGLRGARDQARERELIEAFALDPTRRVRTYSTGNRQKVMLIAAFAAPTPLLVLDEPTSGLDPLMDQVFSGCVQDAAREGRTVLLSSHILGEVERLCTDVTIIRQGQVVESGSLEELRHLAALEVTLGGEPAQLDRVRARLDHAGHPLSEVDGVGGKRHTSVVARVERDRLPEVLATVAEAGLTEVTVEPASLESLFLRHYEGAAR
ncbi:ABC transporter ATP-binding protein [Ornithinimicrobium sp. Y1847]|uniref:ABC transporter ATP-binding protein n=1 Tax=Ornithinimicrobium sp. Y1847 TaxID=3405419 RepID=UPI003B679109